MTAFLNTIIVLAIILVIIKLVAIKRQQTNPSKQVHKTTSPKADKVRVIVPEPNTPSANNSVDVKWDISTIKELEWKLFEDLCMEFLKIKNCNAQVTSTGADGGIDIKVRDTFGNIIAIAQCKAWNSKPIGVNLIRELFGIMAADKVRLGVYLTTSTYTSEAKDFAKDKPLVLVDADELVMQINKLSDEDKKRIELLVYQDDRKTPTCVKCNIKLIKRSVKSGANAGREFWGCINYPKCKITMSIRKEQLNG